MATSWRTGMRRPRPGAMPVRHEVAISLAEAFHGTARMLDVDGRRIEVKIPPGARSGTKVRVADAIITPGTGQRNDLYLVIQVADDPRFARKGSDLTTEINVNLYAAVLGGEVTVPTMTGNVVLKIPAGTQPGQSIRLAGRGMPNLKDPATHGDLLVRVKVKLPRNLTAHQRELFEELARSQS